MTRPSGERLAGVACTLVPGRPLETWCGMCMSENRILDRAHPVIVLGWECTFCCIRSGFIRSAGPQIKAGNNLGMETGKIAAAQLIRAQTWPQQIS